MTTGQSLFILCQSHHAHSHVHCGWNTKAMLPWWRSLGPLPQAYLLRGPVEQAPVPQGFVSSGILVHFIIGVGWEPHLKWRDTNQRAGFCTHWPWSPSSTSAPGPCKQTWGHCIWQTWASTCSGVQWARNSRAIQENPDWALKDKPRVREAREGEDNMFNYGDSLVQQKPTQHCKAIVFQLKNKIQRAPQILAKSESLSPELKLNLSLLSHLAWGRKQWTAGWGQRKLKECYTHFTFQIRDYSITTSWATFFIHHCNPSKNQLTTQMLPNLSAPATVS